MIKAPEQLAQLNRVAIDASLAIAKIAMDSAEQLARLQMNTVRQLLDESVTQAKALAGTKDPQEFAATRISTLEHGLEQMVAYSRSVYEVSAKAQGEIGKILEDRYTAFRREVAELVDEAASAAPAGAEPAIAIVKQSMAATTQAIDALAKMTKQATDMADANVKPAANAATTEAKARAKKHASARAPLTS
jgi:phasin family protein